MATEAAPSASRSAVKSPEAGDDGFVRLHITPFDADLFKIVVPASAAPSARNISYHTIETFPEKRYGFVELPKMEADKVKKRLNGATLKGSKVRIEKARPEKQIDRGEEDDKKDKKKKKPKSKSSDADEQEERPKKRKREMGVIDGVVLKDRKVKRGWTEPLDYKNKKSKKDRDTKGKDKDAKRKQSRSKYIDQEECLLKTRVPPNEMGNLPKEEDPDKKKKKKKGSSRQVTVHEFEKTTKFMNFLRDAAPEAKGSQATEYVEGKGWVDEDGNVVEEVKEKVKPKPAPKTSSEKKEQPAPVDEDEEDTTSGSDTSSEEDTSDEDSDNESEDEAVDVKASERPAAAGKVNGTTSEEANNKMESNSDSDSSSSESDDSDDEATPTPETAEATAPDSTTKPLSIDIPPPPSTPKAVHPLEALYKKPKADGTAAVTPAEESKGFSFFGDDIEEEDESGDAPGTAVPMTPYTQKEFEWRNVRSAAPTPDTVHPARMQSFFPGDDVDMDDVDAEEHEEDAEPAAAGQQGTTDFQKWFWENRRDLNRSWMTRRKTAAKEKRHRDNKARASKAA